jgi:hypothetical protein
LSVAAIRFDTPRADAQRGDQSCRHDANLVAELCRRIGDLESLRRGFEYNPRGLLAFEIRSEPRRRLSNFFQDAPVGGADTNLGFSAAQIDSNMVHGWSLLLRYQARRCGEAPFWMTSV